MCVDRRFKRTVIGKRGKRITDAGCVVVAERLFVKIRRVLTQPFIDTAIIEKQVIDQVIKDLLEPEFFKGWMRDVNRRHWEQKRGAAKKAEQLQERLEAANHEIEALVDAIDKRTLPLEVIEPQVNTLYEEKKHLEAEIQFLRLDDPPVKIISDGDFREYAHLLRESLEDTETYRDILKALVKNKGTAYWRLYH